MTITAALIQSTPYRLRYLLTHDAQAGDSLTIPNDGGNTPDLTTDASGGPLKERVIDLTGLVSQAAARAFLNSDDAARTFLTNHLVGRAVLDLVPRSGTPEWFCDANIDGQGDAVVEVGVLSGAASECYLDIHFRHTAEL